MLEQWLPTMTVLVEGCNQNKLLPELKLNFFCFSHIQLYDFCTQTKNFIEIIFHHLCYRLLGVIEQNAAYMYNGLLSHLPVGGEAVVLAAHCEESECKTVYSTCMFTMYV